MTTQIWVYLHLDLVALREQPALDVVTGVRKIAAHNGTYGRYSGWQVTAHNAGYGRPILGRGGWASGRQPTFADISCRTIGCLVAIYVRPIGRACG